MQISSNVTLEGLHPKSHVWFAVQMELRYLCAPILATSLLFNRPAFSSSALPHHLWNIIPRIPGLVAVAVPTYEEIPYWEGCISLPFAWSHSYVSWNSVTLLLCFLSLKNINVTPESPPDINDQLIIGCVQGSTWHLRKIIGNVARSAQVPRVPM